jgi:hypothetical protein
MASFLDKNPNSTDRKEKNRQGRLYQTKKLLQSRRRIYRVKRQPIGWEKIGVTAKVFNSAMRPLSSELFFVGRLIIASI